MLLLFIIAGTRESSILLRGIALGYYSEYQELHSTMAKLPVAAEKSDKQFLALSRKHYIAQLNVLLAQSVAKYFSISKL